MLAKATPRRPRNAFSVLNGANPNLEVGIPSRFGIVPARRRRERHSRLKRQSQVYCRIPLVELSTVTHPVCATTAAALDPAISSKMDIPIACDSEMLHEPSEGGSYHTSFTG